MERKEPYATQEEFNKLVIRFHDIPPVEMLPGVHAKIVTTEKVSIETYTFAPNSRYPTHHHESEQIMIFMEGAGDELVDGKLYPVKGGDIIIIPSNVEHGLYTSDRGCYAITISAPPRYDLVAKIKALKDEAGLK